MRINVFTFCLDKLSCFASALCHHLPCGGLPASSRLASARPQYHGKHRWRSSWLGSIFKTAPSWDVQGQTIGCAIGLTAGGHREKRALLGSPPFCLERKFLGAVFASIISFSRGQENEAWNTQCSFLPCRCLFAANNRSAGFTEASSAITVPSRLKHPTAASKQASKQNSQGIK